MIKVTKPGPNRIDIEIRGSIDGLAMREGLDAIIEQSEGVTGGRMLYTIDDLKMPTMGALGIEMTRLPQLMSVVSRFDRCAVLSDTPWLRQAAELEGAMIPGLRIKAFEAEDRAAAEAWLAAED
jgi:hypothetical protein